jgi:Cu+-exporting ATPase
MYYTKEKYSSEENIKVIKKCSERFQPPVSRMLYDFTKYRKIKLTHFQEITGQGILATINGVVVQIGS